MNSQLSLYEQLLRVRTISWKHGYYDASEFIQQEIEAIEQACITDINCQPIIVTDNKITGCVKLT